MILYNRAAFLIADHRSNLRYTLYKLLISRFMQCTIKQVPDTEKLLEAAAANYYDIIFIDHCLPPLNGFNALEQLAQHRPGNTVILFGADCNKQDATEALMSNAAAFFSWQNDAAHILHTVQEVMEHRLYITQEQMQLIRSAQQQRKQQSKLPPLTKREKQELALLAKGYTTKQIADTLFIGKRTAENYRNHLLQKTGTHNTTCLLLFAKQAGWLNEENDDEGK